MIVYKFGGKWNILDDTPIRVLLFLLYFYRVIVSYRVYANAVAWHVAAGNMPKAAGKLTIVP